MTEFVERNNFFDPYQNAYKRNFSTQTALVKVLYEIRLAMDLREMMVSVFFDFSKAFDCVDHRRLISRLRDFNFSNSALRILCSYLSGRMQMVCDSSNG